MNYILHLLETSPELLDCYNKDLFLRVALEKFAQAVVKDCAKEVALVAVSSYETVDVSWAATTIIKNIYSKFGIKNETGY